MQIDRYKLILYLDVVVIFFSLILFSPFITSRILFPKAIKYTIILSAGLYLIWRVNRKIIKKTLDTCLIVLLLVCAYFIYYLFLDSKAVNNTFDLFIRASYCITLFAYLSIDKYLIFLIKFFPKIILYTALMTILSLFFAHFELVPFHKKVLADYTVNYNILFGFIHPRFSEYRPSLYFVEPSYLGFFLGFSLFFLVKANWLKRRLSYCAIVFIAGLLTGSFTFYISTLVVLIIMIIYRFTPVQLKAKFFRWSLIGFLLVSVIYLSDAGSIKSTILSSYKTSFDTRKERAANSINLIKNENIFKFVLGLGPGSIAKSRELGESNAYLKLLIEEGLFASVLVFLLIYTRLKYNQYILFFSLIALHSVVLIETPLFIFLLLLSSIFSKLNFEPEKYLRFLANEQ